MKEKKKTYVKVSGPLHKKTLCMIKDNACEAGFRSVPSLMSVRDIASFVREGWNLRLTVNLTSSTRTEFLGTLWNKVIHISLSVSFS